MKKSVLLAIIAILVLSIGVITLSSCNEGNQAQMPSDTTNSTPSDTPGNTTNSAPSDTTNNIKESDTDAHIHAFEEWTQTKKPTCTDDGINERYCSCGEKQTQTIEANGHTEVIDSAVAATCTTDGKTEGKHCSACNETIVAQTIVKAFGHTEVIDPAVSATCTQTGLTQGKHCSRCSEVTVVQRELPPLLHEYDNGFCKNCSAYDELAKSEELLCEALRHERAITAIIDGHNWLVELNKSRIAELKSQYGISYVYDDASCYSKISEINSTIYDLNYQISRLEMYNDPADRSKLASLKQQKTSLENQKAKYEAMRSINDYENRILSYNDDYERNIANETNLYEKNKLNIELKYARDEKICKTHQWGEWKVESEVSCLEIGLRTRYCKTCELVENDITEKLDHTIVIEEYIPATCTQSGMTEGQYCSVCNTILVAKETIGATGHNYSEWTLIREASCALDGLKKKTCLTCGLEEKEFTQHLEHTYSESNICTSCDMLKPSDGLIYKLNSDNESYRLTSDGTCTDSIIIIAQYYLGKPVTYIADNAFSYNSSAATIIIPDGIETLGKWAFCECTALTNITIPSSVKSVDKSTFLDCTSLETVTILPGITNISDYVFQGCTSLTNVNIPNTVTSIGKSIFRGCTSLTNINLANGFSTLSEKMFYECSNLTTISIPNSVTSISSSAFESCSNLSNITIPNNVTYIGISAFKNCTNLGSLVISRSVSYLGPYAFGGCISLSNITFEGTATEWNAITKETGWNTDVPATEVICSDGVVKL